MTIDFPDADPRGTHLRLLIERAKYERFVQGEVDALLAREFNRIADLVLSGKYRSLTLAQRQRAIQLFREIERRLGAGYRDVTTLVLREMQGYAVLEADVARALVTASLTAGGGSLTISLGPSLSRTFLASIAKLPIQGLSIGEWFDAQARTMSVEARRIIQQGLVEGKAPIEISRRLLADQRAQGPVLSRRAKQDARIIARTTVNAVQNHAAMASYESLPPEVSDSYRWVSVRDTRLSAICAALDGRVFRYDDPKRRVPPAHPNCRSTTLPLLKGAEATLADQRTQPLTMGGMGAWLTAQPTSAQNAILGAGRAALWRDGRLSLADAIDADNRLLTLKQLREQLDLTAVAAE